MERGPGSSGTPAVSGILHIGVDTSGEATVVTPVGVLSVSTAAQLRDTLLKCVADQPTAVIIDLTMLHLQSSYALSVFGVVARRTSDWSGVRLVLVTGTETRGRLNLRTKTLARFVQIAPTLEAALASIRRPPIRRVVTHSLAAEPASVRAAGSLVALTCDRWGCPDLTDDAVAVAGELVGNAIGFTGADLTLRLELRRGLLTVAVTDETPRSPVRRAGNRPDDAAGHAEDLSIVGARASGWGSAVTTTGGKTVWALLRSARTAPGAGRLWPLPPGTATGDVSRTAGDRGGRGRLARWVDRENELGGST